MTDDMGFGVGLGELFQEGTHGGFLGLGAGVFGNAFFVETVGFEGEVEFDRCQRDRSVTST